MNKKEYARWYLLVEILAEIASNGDVYSKILSDKIKKLVKIIGEDLPPQTKRRRNE